jgi:hypothetical protein
MSVDGSSPYVGGGGGKVVDHVAKEIGTMEQVIGEDIGLALVSVPISNRFLEHDIPPLRLIPTGEVNSDGHVIVDSYYTGEQKLKNATHVMVNEGKLAPRIIIILCSNKVSINHPHPLLLRSPVMYLGMCGTPSHRIGNRIDPPVQACGDILNEAKEEALNRLQVESNDVKQKFERL